MGEHSDAKEVYQTEQASSHFSDARDQYYGGTAGWTDTPGSGDGWGYGGDNGYGPVNGGYGGEGDNPGAGWSVADSVSGNIVPVTLAYQFTPEAYQARAAALAAVTTTRQLLMEHQNVHREMAWNGGTSFSPVGLNAVLEKQAKERARLSGKDFSVPVMMSMRPSTLAANPNITMIEPDGPHKGQESFNTILGRAQREQGLDYLNTAKLADGSGSRFWQASNSKMGKENDPGLHAMEDPQWNALVAAENQGKNKDGTLQAWDGKADPRDITDRFWAWIPVDNAGRQTK